MSNQNQGDNVMLMEFSEASPIAYAIAVRSGDFKAAGDDVVDKIASDLRLAGKPIEHSLVRAVTVACHRQALHQTQVTD